MEFESHLRDSVLEQAHENGRQLVANAQETLDRETKEQKVRLKQEKMQQREQEVKVLKRQVQREVQQLENEKTPVYFGDQARDFERIICRGL